jgi:peroxiredoxin
LLRFYPGDFSAVCGEKLCEFRDTDWLAMNPDVSVFGISTDTIPAHSAFINELGLNFPLLSDNNATVCKQFDVCVEEIAGHRIDGGLHAVYIVDDDRRIQYAWSVDMPPVPDLETFKQMKATETEVEIQPDCRELHAALEAGVDPPREPF